MQSWYTEADVTALSLVSATPVKMGAYSITNVSGGTTFVQFFDAAATSDVTLGTTLPAWQQFVGSGLANEAHFTSSGLLFKNGLVIAATTASHGGTEEAAGVDISIGYD
ncbi:MAG TPA: hypothetical protein VFG22_02015 [Polyangiales bacterium]|nr:hypothetical protein [Polyangiales bacterium]